MRRVQAGDPEAFGVLYDRFARRAHRIALAVVQDRTRVEDVVQDAFLSIWRGRASYEPSLGGVAAWVLSTVRHRALDCLRRNGRHDRRRADEEDLDMHVSSLGGPEDAAIEREHAAGLRRAMGRLPEAQREVIVLAYFGQLSTAEIARQLSVPMGTVKGRMRLGLMKLRSPAADEHQPATADGRLPAGG